MEKKELMDKLAWVTIYGGSWLVQAGLLAAAVAAGLVTKSQASMVGRCASHCTRPKKEKAWKIYKETGNLWLAIENIYG